MTAFVRRNGFVGTDGGDPNCVQNAGIMVVMMMIMMLVIEVW